MHRYGSHKLKRSKTLCIRFTTITHPVDDCVHVLLQLGKRSALVIGHRQGHDMKTSSPVLEDPGSADARVPDPEALGVALEFERAQQVPRMSQ